MYNNTIEADEIGILSSGKYPSIKNSEITVNAEGIGIKLAEGSVNALVALNVIKDAQTSVLVEKGFNCVVLLNSLIGVKGYNNKNLYVNENKLGGYIELKDNNYLLCNQNTFNKDGLEHPIINSGNLNFNGNNLHDITERVEHGANEELLPHTNKDLFLEMEKRNTVRDISQAKSYDFASYLKAYSMGGDTTIIIAPGVYNLSSTIVLGKAHSNTKLYAYGVYLEKESLGGILQFNQSQNYTVKGLTIGYEHQSSGQVYVLEKLENNKIRVVSNAGYLNDFGRSNTTVFSGSWNNMFKSDSLVPWIDISSNYEFVSKEDDGTMHCTFRNLAAAGVLMSIETTWGESTVAQDITVESCLFENTGYYFNTQSDMKRAALSIQGLGELSNNVTVSEDTLPCRNITIKNNKFNGTRNNYYIAVSAAQNVVIEGNVFCDKDGETTQKPAKAINISGCYNVNISGNTYSSFAGGDVTKAIVANNYKELIGSDVEGIFPTQKDPVK